MMDYFSIPAYRWRPTGICCYSMGSFGGVRASMQVRCFMGELGSPTMNTVLAIPQIQNVLSDTGEVVKRDNGDRLEKNAEKLIKKLSWYSELSEALKCHPEKVGRPSH